MERFEELIAVCRQKDIEVSQNFAVKVVGGKDRLRYLIQNGCIRARKAGKAQNAMRRCKVEDVFKYARLK